MESGTTKLSLRIPSNGTRKKEVLNEQVVRYRSGKASVN